MNCIEHGELEQFLTGKLRPERLLAVDAHVAVCSRCRAAIAGIPARRRQAVNLAAALLEVQDCPDYEELSAFVDRTLEQDRARAVLAHANACEPCSRDIERIQQLRSHAAMRENVRVRPGASRRALVSPWVYWRRAVAGVAAAAAVAALAIGIGRFGTGPTQTAQPPVAIPPVHRDTVVKQPERPVSPEVTPPQPDKTVAVKPPEQSPRPAPKYTSLLKDGPFQVVEQEGKVAFATSSGALVRTKLEAQIEAAILEKLRTGKITPPEPVVVAMDTVRVRGDGFVPSPVAPTLKDPAARIVMSASPTLRWTAVDMAQAYRVRIYDAEGRALVDEVTDKTSLVPPVPLERGRAYAWRVAVRFSESDSWTDSAPARFKVLSAESVSDIEAVRARLPGSRLALGAAYESVGLYREAAAEYRKLLLQNPDSALARRLVEAAPAE